MSIEQSMDKVLARRDEVESRLADAASMSPDELASLSRELSELRPVCEQIDLVRRLEGDRDAAVMLAEEAADDAEMAEMAQAEIQEIEARLPEEMNSLQLLLLPRDRDDRETRSSRCAPVPVVTRRRCSPPTCSACISDLRQSMAGGSR